MRSTSPVCCGMIVPFHDPQLTFMWAHGLQQRYSKEIQINTYDCSSLGSRSFGYRSATPHWGGDSIVSTDAIYHARTHDRPTACVNNKMWNCIYRLGHPAEQRTLPFIVYPAHQPMKQHNQSQVSTGCHSLMNSSYPTISALVHLVLHLS
jgi:hypothetical protein